MPLSQGHDRQSRSPVGLTRWYRLCTTRVFQGDCYECVPGYAAHPPVSTPFFPGTATLRGCQGHHRARVVSGLTGCEFSGVHTLPTLAVA